MVGPTLSLRDEDALATELALDSRTSSPESGPFVLARIPANFALLLYVRAPRSPADSPLGFSLTFFPTLSPTQFPGLLERPGMWPPRVMLTA
ncbi:hypothetical protein MRX96_004989 [Rhipicephalus microplus]